MNTQVLTQSYNQILAQRNRLLVACLLSFLLSLLLGLSNFYLIGRERIVLVPPVINRAFWVSLDHVSEAYLQEMSQYFAGLLLTLTPSTLSASREQLLQNVAPQYYAQVKSQLIEQQKELERRGLSTSFYPTRFKIEASKYLVELQGELKIFVGSALLEAKTKTYQLQFTQQQGRLFIQSFTEVEPS